MPTAEVQAADPLEDAYYDYLLRLGDDALILGQRLGEWCGHAPSVEVDLSLANVALDLIGQATHILNQANNGDGDELAFKRDVLATLKLKEDRFGFEPEFTAEVARAKWRVVEVSVSYAPRTHRAGKKITVRDGLSGVWCTVRSGLRGRRAP